MTYLNVLLCYACQQFEIKKFTRLGRHHTVNNFRPAGRCLQLVRPIRGRAGRKGGYYHHVQTKFPVITMIPTKTLTPKIIHKHNFIGCNPWSLPPGDHLHCCLIYEGGATSIANFCCQITTEQFDQVQFTQKHVIMLIKTVGYRHCPLVNGFKVGLNVSVSGLRPVFHRI